VEIRAEILRTSKRLPAPTPMGTSNMVHHHTGDQQYGAPSHWGPAIWCTITLGTACVCSPSFISEPVDWKVEVNPVPPLSSDITPLNFFLWGYEKNTALT